MSKFDSMPIPKGSRGDFDFNKQHTSTMDFFRWDVAHCFECVPHDVISLNLHTFVDGAPNPYPINGHMRFGHYAFYVPTRIVWDQWTNYIADLNTGLTIPYFTVADLYNALNTSAPFFGDPALRADALRFISNILNLSAITQFLDEDTYSSVSDIPSKVASLHLSAIPLRCIQRIWFDWMRDKAHISDTALGSYCITTGGHISSAELIMLITPKYRLFGKNYITTAFDKPAEVNAIVSYDKSTSGVGRTYGRRYTWGYESPTGTLGTIQTEGPGLYESPNGSNKELSGLNIQDLRSSNSVQAYAERMLVAGKTVLSRFKALFGTSPTIEELQMSDYLGGHEEDLYFKTSGTPATTTAADGSDPGIGSAGSFGYNPTVANFAGQKYMNIESPENGCGLENVTYKTDEHGFLFVMSAITPVPQYYQGLDRSWTRGLDTFASDKFDFFHQDFENEGLQPVLNYEVCFSGRGDSSYDPRGVLGFQQKYMDYKYAHDSLGGDFINPGAFTGLNNMHLGRNVQKVVEDLESVGHPVNEFLTPAILVQATTTDKEEYDKKFTVTSPLLDHFIVNHRIVLHANRPMMQNALPALSASESRQTAKDLIETSGFRL